MANYQDARPLLDMPVVSDIEGQTIHLLLLNPQMKDIEHLGEIRIVAVSEEVFHTYAMQWRVPGSRIKG